MKNCLKTNIKRLFAFSIILLCFVFVKVHAQSSNFEIINQHQAKAAFYGTPLVTEQFVVIGCHDKNIYFFNHQGKLLKIYRTNGIVHATASELKNGNIVIGSYDKHLYFFNAEGNFIKRIKIGGKIFTNVVENGNGDLIFGCNNAIVCLNPETNQFTKKHQRNIVHGSVQKFKNGNIAIGSNENKVYFFNSKNKIINQYKTNGWVLHSQPIELKNGMIAFGSYDNFLHFTSNTGQPYGKIYIGGEIHSSPIETQNEQIICTAFNKWVYFISPKGNIEYKFKTEGKIVASPAETPNGNILIGSYDKNLYLLSPKAEMIDKICLNGKIFSSPQMINNTNFVCATTKGKVFFIKLKK